MELSTTSSSLDSLRPIFEEAVEYQITANNNNNNYTQSEASNTIQPYHASQSTTFFPPTPTTGFIKATVINHGLTLELRWISTIKAGGYQQNPLLALDHNSSHQPVHFHFQSKIIPTPFITVSNDRLEELQQHQLEPQSTTATEAEGEVNDEDEEHANNLLIILILTENYTLHRLKFRYPRLFHSELFEEDWLTSYEVEEIINRQVILSHGIDANNLIISSSDGTLTHLSWGKLIGINDNYGWKTSNLCLNRSSLWNFLPTSWSSSSSSAILSSKTISSSAHEWVATPTSTISIASHITAGASGEDAWLFTISRDRKLKAWSLTTGLCLKELSLQHSLITSSTNSDLSSNQNNHHNSLLLPAAPRTLARFIYSDQGDDPSYEGFLILFIPSPVTPSFVTYGLSLTGENQFRDLVLLEERGCDWNQNTRLKMSELRDFQISKVDLSISYTTSPSQQRPWGLWAVWDDDMGGEGIIQYTVLHETRNWQESVRTQWLTIQPPDRKAPWNSSYFDELLANNPSSSVTQVFIDHLFRPGHFSFSDLEYAMDTYECTLEVEEIDNGLYETLQEKICALVGSNIKLEISSHTGVPMIEDYHRNLRIEWLKFATMCAESRASSLWPIELALDADRQQVFVNGRRSITTLVLIDTASLLSQLVQSVNCGETPPLLNQQVSGIDQFHPLLSNLNNRLDLVSLVSAIDCLISGLSHGQVIKPLEDDLAQAVRRPMKFSMVEFAEELFNRRLDPFINDTLHAKISEKLERINGLELAFQMLWNILSTSELVRSGPDQGGDGDSVTTLSQMLLSDYLVNALEKRFELTRNTLIFLIYFYDQDISAESFGDFASLISQYLVTFQQSIMSRWICRQCAKIPGELAFEVEDKLVDKLLELHVSNRNEIVGHPEGVMITDANSSISTMSSLLLTKFIPELNARLKLPGSLAEAGSLFLEQTGLFKNLSRLSDQELSTIRLIHTEPRIIQLGHFFLKVGLVSLALELAQMLPDAGCGIEFLKGLAYLKSGLIEEAENCFLKAPSAICDDNFEVDDQSGLRLILPEAARKSLTDYYSYVVTLFEPVGADQSVAKFCQLAIDSHQDSLLDDDEDDNDDDDEDEEEEEEDKEKDKDKDLDREGLQELVLQLWVKLFKACLNLCLWDDAYQALINIPSLESQHDCLRSLVSHMCEANEVDRLIHFTWLGLQTEFEKTISFRARNSDPLVPPNYFAILYAYHMNRADYRSAAIAMYQHGRKIGDISLKGGAFQFLMTQQCQSYLAAINALSLVPEKHAWIPMSCPKQVAPSSYDSEAPTDKPADVIRRRKRVTYHVPEEEFLGGSRDVEVLKLADIREEYTLVLTRLELANEMPQLSEAGARTMSGGQLDGATMVPMILNQGRVMAALEKARVLGTDVVPLFVRLTESCCRMTVEGGASHVRDAQWVVADPLAADWEADVVSKAWRLLQLHLQLAFPISATGSLAIAGWRAREAVLETICNFSRAIKLPLWLLDLFLHHRPNRLLRTLFKFDLLSDAFTVAFHILDQVKRPSPTGLAVAGGAPGATAGSIPFSDLDQLLTMTSDDLLASLPANNADPGSATRQPSLTPERLRELQAELTDQLIALFPSSSSSSSSSFSPSSLGSRALTSSRELIGR
ncbi:hypothetical protein PCASD_01568 [Puccinia coronata f. sp. avenae]|uniref:Nuclear pore complex protein Nup160 n=1 Tax=Puccinia coronata f. sp. avenae TaxID=200324 RepID=A0A2N5VID2_9BASI|nr:hypothetical protein PCASD_01568 [Puccinia coronata f. sp. avenae]